MKRASLVFGRGLTLLLAGVLMVSCSVWSQQGHAPRSRKSVGMTKRPVQSSRRASARPTPRTRAQANPQTNVRRNTPAQVRARAAGQNKPRPDAAKPSPNARVKSSADRVIHPYEGLTVYPDQHILEIEAYVCLDGGWLEQIACSPGTREHESLMTINAKPSEVHAALLLAGYKPGKPGKWVYEEDAYRTVPPQGNTVMISVRYQNRDDKVIEEPIRNWIIDHQGNHEFPPTPWVFGGSKFAANPDGMEPGEYYIADFSGSIIGLVTFGDEVLGFAEVISDQEVVSPPEWVINEDAIPPIGTKVTIVIRGFKRKK